MAALSPARLISWFARGVASAFLPSPERERVAAPAGVSPPRWSFLFGVIGAVGGFLLYFEGGMGFMGDLIPRQTMALLQARQPITETDVRGGGLLAWFAWHLQPQAWLYLYICLTGVVGVVAFAASREAVSEPAIWFPMRLLQRRRRRVEHEARMAELGPRRPDRVLEEDGCALVVLSCRPKEDWNESATIEIGERQYQLIDVADRDDGRWKVIAYRLREARPEDAVRRVVKTRLKAPAGHLGGARRAPLGKVWYFAFGLSMAPAVIENVVRDPVLVCTAQLSRHALRFARPAADGSGEAAAIPTNNPSDLVWGVVWECAEDDAEALADLESIGENCSWHAADVRDADAVRYAVQVAIVDEEARDLDLLPTREYRDRLLEAARAHRFAKIYLGLICSSPVA
jgi:hypothetical protein